MSKFAKAYMLIKEYLETGDHGEQVSEQTKELYQQYLQKLTWGIQKQDIESVRTETDQFRYIRSVFEKYLQGKDTETNIAYQVGIVIGESKVGDAWIRDQQNDSQFNYNMMILLSKAHIKEILMSIYNCPGIQHKNLAFQADIKANYLNQLATTLEKAGCIRRFGTGKCTYYELTLKGRDYVKEYLVVKRDTYRKINYLKEAEKFNTVSAEQKENSWKMWEEKLESGYKYKGRDNVITMKEMNEYRQKQGRSHYRLNFAWEEALEN